MKNVISFFTLFGIVAISISKPVSAQTVSCPSGDTVKCVVFSSGGIVYKGKELPIVRPNE